MHLLPFVADQPLFTMFSVLVKVFFFCFWLTWDLWGITLPGILRHLGSLHHINLRMNYSSGRQQVGLLSPLICCSDLSPISFSCGRSEPHLLLGAAEEAKSAEGNAGGNLSPSRARWDGRESQREERRAPSSPQTSIHLDLIGLNVSTP